jgi:hypothetical protein
VQRMPAVQCKYENGCLLMGAQLPVLRLLRGRLLIELGRIVHCVRRSKLPAWRSSCVGRRTCAVCGCGQRAALTTKVPQCLLRYVWA